MRLAQTALVLVAVAACAPAPAPARNVAPAPPPPPAASAPEDEPEAEEPPAPQAPTETQESMLSAGQYVAYLFTEGQTTRCAFWAVEAGGVIRASAFDSNCLPEEPPLPLSPRYESDAPVEPGVAACSNADPPVGQLGQAPIGPHETGRLTLPGATPQPVRLQWYASVAGCKERAVLAPLEPDSSHWLLVLSQDLLSPMGEVLAPAIGDLDGDGRDDLAFVAAGVGTCGGEGRPDCPLLWVDLFTTQAPGFSTDATRTLVRGADVARFETSLGPLGELQWSGRIRQARYLPEAHGKRRARGWQFALVNGSLGFGGSP
jgi:hypothetical protein